MVVKNIKRALNDYIYDIKFYNSFESDADIIYESIDVYEIVCKRYQIPELLKVDLDRCFESVSAHYRCLVIELISKKDFNAENFIYHIYIKY
jgi:hypothetical protein